MKRWITALVAFGIAAPAWAYTYLTNSYGQPIYCPPGKFTMQLMVDNTTVLSDGTTRATTIEAAMSQWNAQIEAVQFLPQIAPVGQGSAQNGVNEIFFSSSAYGYSWGQDTLAITIYWTSGTEQTEADIIFNTAYTWDSYRGPLRTDGVIDIQRVALHELGHVLGLGHPDQATPPQMVNAIMNSTISDTDTLQPDDIAGAQSLYGAPNAALAPPVITSPPASQAVGSGESAQFTAQASGTPPPDYHWQRLPAGTTTWTDLSDGGAYSGTDTATLTVTGTTTAMKGDEFRCVATNVMGAVTSSAATLTVNPPSAPTITKQPTDMTVAVDATATFSVTATGTEPLAYQWAKDGTALANGGTISGVDGPTLTITGAQAGDAGTYHVTVSNVAGSVVSQDATLVVAASPVLSQRPLSQAVTEGQTASFTVVSSDPGPLTYAWVHDGQVIPGANGSTLNVANTSLADNGWYQVVVSNAAGGVARSVFYLTVGVAHTTPVVWGEIGQPPSGLSNLLGLGAAGTGSQVVAVTADGKAVVWGGGIGDGQGTVPADLTGVVRVATGSSAAAAVKADGTVAVWGYINGTSPPTSELTNVVDVAVGYAFALALRADGTVVAWGDNSSGQCNVPADLTGVVAIAAGLANGIALKGDGTVVGWGNGTAGTSVPAGLTGVTAISAGDSHALALKSDGTVVAWGEDYAGCTDVPAGLTNVIAIAAGGSHSLALKADGTVVAWGRPYEGQTTVPAAVTGATAISAGEMFSAALIRTAPPTITTQPTDQSVTLGDYTAFTVSVSGTAPFSYQWKKDGVPIVDGGNISGATTATLGISDTQETDSGTYTVDVTNNAGTVTSNAATLVVPVPPAITARPLSRLATIGQSVSFTLETAASSGITYIWKHNGRVITGATGPTLTLPSVSRSDGGWYEVTAANTAASSISVFNLNVTGAGDSAVGWGDDFYGQTSFPADLTGVAQVSVGYDQTLVLKLDGTIEGFPATGWVPSASGVVAVSAGYEHNLAVKSDGTVVAAGFDGNGETDVPAGLTDAVAVAAGQFESLALRADGKVVAWGSDASGATTVPPGLSHVVAIAAGWDHFLALKDDGTVVAWGDNQFGQLDIPAGLTDVVAIAAGAWHNLALKSDGTVVAWGGNQSGQSSPPPDLSDVVAVAGGWEHSLAVRADGSVVAWGNDASGQTDVPADLTGVEMVAAGGSVSVALVAGSEPSITTQPASSASVVVGGDASLTVRASGVPAPTLQWQVSTDGGDSWTNLTDGAPYSGTTSATLDITGAAIGLNGFEYRCVATNGLGSVMSDAVTLKVLSRPPPTSDFNGDGQPDVVYQNTSTGVCEVWLMNGTSYGSTAALGTVSSEWQLATTGDFNGDGKPDLVFENTLTGARVVWFMNGTSYVGSAVLGTVPTNWVIAGAADFNGDGHTDLLFQDTTTGACAVWLMDGTSYTGSVSLGSVSPDWELMGAADFNGDGHPDLLFENKNTGACVVWLMDGTSYTGSASLGSVPPDWQIAATGDFNDDGQTDIVFQNLATGQRAIWLMNGTSYIGSVSLGTVSTEMRIAGHGDSIVRKPETTAPDDFNADGTTDLVWHNDSTGELRLWLMGPGGVSSTATLGDVSTDWQVVATGDYTGDGQPDILWRNRTTGDCALWQTSGTSYAGSVGLGSLSSDWTYAGQADFNADGATDILWHNNSTGELRLWLMGPGGVSNTVNLGSVSTDWQAVAAGNYTGAGQTDILWRDSTTGDCALWQMSGTSYAGSIALGKLSSDWTYVGQADFNADGVTDILWHNNSTGELRLWLMGPDGVSDTVSLGTVPTDWQVVAVGDYTGAGQPDVLWRDSTTGDCALWQMNGTRYAGSIDLGSLSSDWTDAK